MSSIGVGSSDPRPRNVDAGSARFQPPSLSRQAPRARGPMLAPMQSQLPRPLTTSAPAIARCSQVPIELLDRASKSEPITPELQAKRVNAMKSELASFGKLTERASPKGAAAPSTPRAPAKSPGSGLFRPGDLLRQQTLRASNPPRSTVTPSEVGGSSGSAPTRPVTEHPVHAPSFQDVADKLEQIKGDPRCAGETQTQLGICWSSQGFQQLDAAGRSRL